MYMEIVSIERKTFEAMSPSSTVSFTVWMQSAIGMGKRQ